MDECKKHGKTDLVILKSGRVKCRICQREYQRLHYKNNSSYYKDKADKREKYLQDFLNRIKRLSGCEVCGETRWWVLDFHHKDGDKKIFNIGSSHGYGYSISTIKDEVRKCNILCSNCHRDLHHKNKHCVIE